MGYPDTDPETQLAEWDQCPHVPPTAPVNGPCLLICGGELPPAEVDREVEHLGSIQI